MPKPRKKPKLPKSQIMLLVPVDEAECAATPDWDGRGHYPDEAGVPLTFYTVVRSSGTSPPHYLLAFNAKGKAFLHVRLEPQSDVRIFMTEYEALELYGHLAAQLPEAARRRVRAKYHAVG